MSVNKELLQRIRSTFLAKGTDRYHPKDVERVNASDWWIERFVMSKKSEEKALKALVKAMEWRKASGINDLTDAHFPKELYELGLLGQFFNDKEGRPVIWMKLSKYHKCSELSELIKQFLIYMIETVDAKTSHQGWVWAVDASDAGLSNMDFDFNMFMVKVLEKYYPLGPKYLISVDLPGILNATVKMILKLMNEQLKSTVKMIAKEELTDYVASDNIPVHLNGKYGKEYVSVPADAKPIEQSKLNSDQIKKFYTTFKSQ